MEVASCGRRRKLPPASISHPVSRVVQAAVCKTANVSANLTRDSISSRTGVGRYRSTSASGCTLRFFPWDGTEPFGEMHCAEAWLPARDKALIVDRNPIVVRTTIGNHLPRIAGSAEELPHKFVLPDLVWSRDVNYTIDGLAEGNLRQRGRNVVGYDGLHENRRQSDICAVGGKLSQAACEYL